MGKATLLLLIIFILVSDPVCKGQTIEVSDPRFELRDNKLHIFYDILNSVPSDDFSVSIRITDATGNEIAASALSGDIGNLVSGGSNKRIIWDLTADEIVMKASIFVKISAKAVLPPVSDPLTLQENKDPPEGKSEKISALDNQDKEVDSPLVQSQKTQDVPKDDISVQERETANTMRPPLGSTKSFSSSSLILQSLPLPGLGLSRLTGNPHWIRGVAAYGCVIGSVALNRMAINTYEQIPQYLDWDDKNDLYQQSRKQDGFSEVLAYTAIGIWISDIIWTIVGTSDLRKSSLYSETNGIGFRTSIDPLSNVPLIGVRYVF